VCAVVGEKSFKTGEGGIGISQHLNGAATRTAPRANFTYNNKSSFYAIWYNMCERDTRQGKIKTKKGVKKPIPKLMTPVLLFCCLFVVA